jgi:hypothetical protein
LFSRRIPTKCKKYAKKKGIVAHKNEPQAENGSAKNGLSYRNRIIGQYKHCEENLADYSDLFFGTILNSYMIATLTVSGSQAICAALQTKLDISGINEHLLKHF